MSVELPFSKAVDINPQVPMKRGETYPFVDMASVNPASRSAAPVALREFKGGGSRFQAGDTLMARITPCLENGKIARYVPDSAHTSVSAHGSTEFYVIRGKAGVTDNEFAYYLTQSDGVRNRAIEQMSGTSGRQRVPIDAFDHIMVSLPPLSEQRAIAHILGTLDDKIELNRKMNQTLEEMVRALFKSWFVDFDPVRAKMDGRWRPGESLPGLPAHLYHLFPDRLIPSQLGEMPEGWEVRTLGEFGEVVTGKTPSTKDPRNFGGCIPFLRIPDMHGRMYALQTQSNLSALGADSQSNKTVPAGSVSVSCIATPGLVVLNHRSTQTNQQINTVIPKSPVYSKFLYWYCRSLSNDIETRSLGGSVFGNINKADFSSLELLYPPVSALNWFESMVGPLHDAILANEQVSATCGQAMDVLLPKLVSGDLQVVMAQHQR